MYEMQPQKRTSPIIALSFKWEGAENLSVTSDGICTCSIRWGFLGCGDVIVRNSFYTYISVKLLTEPREENSRGKAFVITHLWTIPLWEIIEVSIFFKILKIKSTPIVNFVGCGSSNLFSMLLKPGSVWVLSINNKGSVVLFA